MTPRKKRLGRGLDALLSKPVAESTAAAKTTSTDGLAQIPVEHLQRGQYQPRVDIRQDSLEELASSIQAQGIVQPIVARPIASGNNKAQRYEIVAGERRWRAAQMAGLHEVPVIIRDISDESAIAMALIENIQREDLNPMEEAAGLLTKTGRRRRTVGKPKIENKSTSNVKPRAKAKTKGKSKAPGKKARTK